MVNKSKKIEVIEIKKPNIIKGLDFSIGFSSDIFLEENTLLSFFLLRRFEKDLIKTIFYEFIILNS